MVEEGTEEMAEMAEVETGTGTGGTGDGTGGTGDGTSGDGSTGGDTGTGDGNGGEIVTPMAMDPVPIRAPLGLRVIKVIRVILRMRRRTRRRRPRILQP